MRALKISWPWLAILMLWEIAGRTGLISHFILPWPSLLGYAAIEQLSNQTLILDAAASLGRVGLGFMLAAIMGTVLGLLIGASRSAADYLDPVLNFLKPIPPVAWIPLAIVWFGIGNGPAFFLTFVAAFFPIVIGTAHGVKQIAHQHFEVAACLETSPSLLLRRLILPGALPHILASYRIGFGVAWMAVVAAEMIAAQSGLGHLIHISQDVLRTDLVVVGMIMIGLIGLAGDWGLRRLARWLTPWEAR